MASIPMKVAVGITDSEYRPCYIMRRSRRGIAERIYHKALFHKWTLEQEPVGAGLAIGSHPGGQLSCTKALVELEDGTVRQVSPELLKFLDTDCMFEQFYWPPLEELEHDDV